MRTRFLVIALLLSFSAKLLALECDISPLPDGDGLAICTSPHNINLVYSARVRTGSGIRTPHKITLADPSDAKIFGVYHCQDAEFELELAPLIEEMGADDPNWALRAHRPCWCAHGSIKDKS